MPTIHFTKKFLRSLKSLPPDRQDGAKRAIGKFRDNPQTPSLDFRLLKGVAEHFIINARQGDRIVLQREAHDSYNAVDVGPHDNVYRRWNRL